MNDTVPPRCASCPSSEGGVAHGEGVKVVGASSESTHLVMWRTPDGRRRRKRAKDHGLAADVAVDVANQLAKARRFGVSGPLRSSARESEETVPELARSFVRSETPVRGWAASYVDSLDSLIRNYVDRHLSIPVRAWTESRTRNLLEAARGSLGPSKLAQLLSLLRQTATYAHKRSLLLTDPIGDLRVSMPRRHLKTAIYLVDERRVLREVDEMPSTQEVEALAAALDGAGCDGLAARLAGYAGTRFGETFALEREDIDFEQLTISVERQVDPKRRARTGTQMTPDGRRRRHWGNEYGYAALPKGDKVRKTLLPPQLAEDLERRPPGLLFPNASGNYLANQSWWNAGPFHRARDTAKWPRTPDGRFAWTWHSLRHHAATWLLAAGVPIHDLAQILGHSQIETTLRMYVHSDAEAPGRAARQVAARLAGSPQAAVQASLQRVGRAEPLSRLPDGERVDLHQLTQSVPRPGDDRHG